MNIDLLLRATKHSATEWQKIALDALDTIRQIQGIVTKMPTDWQNEEAIGEIQDLCYLHLDPETQEAIKKSELKKQFGDTVLEEINAIQH